MKRLFIVINCLVLAAASVVLIPAFALAAVPSSYTSYGYASGVHAIGGSDAFPNFQNGAVNNRYPLAEVQQDASPSTTAVATYSDSGPLTATVGSQYNQGCTNSGSSPPPPQICQNPNNQVPYAKANYPGPSHGHIDNCNGCDGGSRADADAAQLTASSSAFYAGGGTQPFTGASGQTNTVIDSGGNLTVTTHSEVDSFVIGTVKVGKVVVDVTANSSLSGGGGEATVKGGEVTANGQPVSVNDQGVTIQDKRPLPCPAAPAPKPPVQVPAPPPPPPGPIPPLPIGGGSSGGSSSGSSGGTSSGCVPTFDVTYITIYTIAPVKTVDGSHVTIWATGLHIKVTHPSPGPGVPTQSAEYVLGEGFADLQVGSGGSAFDFGGFGGFGAGFGDFGGFGDQTGGANGPGSGLSNLGTTLAANRIPLAFMFLTLEALLLAAAAAWVWARNTPLDRVPDEVLSP
ncbi:MAG: hypothetical protein E6I41_06275 [Chloroflexi bacterium]|nr:MAG: hypothetical protein E6I41_06275 [Chloroflexota bacterium]